MLSKKLIKWYHINKRSLPWRDTQDPYRIWISEIILQQTRVAQGYEYYLRFIEKLPDISSLAKANEHDILLLWQGLGYYSRARNLHFAAKTIVEKHNGVFPSNYEEILSLKGIGEYTAAAISSFAYNLPHAVLDGNVYRFLSRFFGITTPIDTTNGKKEFAKLAQELIDRKNPGLYNQAIMEFGALHCTPDNPKCDCCPFSEQCIAYNENRIKQLPVKQGKIKSKDRFFYYLDIRFQNNPSNILLNKRTQKDIWQNLFELPLIETNSSSTLEELIKLEDFNSIFSNTKKLQINPVGITFKHILSHQKINATFYRITISEGSTISKDFSKIEESNLSDYPISRLVDRYFKQISKPNLFS